MSKPMGHVGITLFGLYFIVLSIFSAYVIIKVWPDPAAAAEAAELPAIKLLPFLPPLELGIEVRLSLIAALAGALGAFVHAATSFSSYVGNRELKRSWGWWYGLRPRPSPARGRGSDPEVPKLQGLTPNRQGCKV